MKALNFYIVDVFAEEKYAGNQLAVVRNAGKLSSSEMQKIAHEMNYSETTFVLSDTETDHGYDVRIFTPKEEVPFAGHPTLGTAFIIQKEIIKTPVDGLNLNLQVGKIPVRFTYLNGEPDVLWMKQVQPKFGLTFNPEPITKTLNIETPEIDPCYPIQEVSTGLPFIIVPLKTLDSVKKCRINQEKLVELVKSTEAKAILVFCPETYHQANDLNVRVFVDYYGIPEDPATGSGNGCLAGYLVKYRYLSGEKIDLRVEQGYEIDRPSLLLLKAEQSGEMIQIEVGGQVVMIARGELI
jgi:trans-2,3-dihydro-3-hydroxyanthranilate isomerase